MPELPDVVVYIEALASRIVGARLDAVRVVKPFLLRSVHPPLDAVVGRAVQTVRRLGKRIVVDLEGQLFLVIHLRIAHRPHRQRAGAKILARGRARRVRLHDGHIRDD